MAAPVIEDLRRQLREKFPQAHAASLMTPAGKTDAGQSFDPAFFPPGAISEALGSGLSLLIAGLLGEPEEVAPLPDFILVDGGDQFDPASFTPEACSRLVWVRCGTAMEMLKTTDLLVRDANIPFVLLDTCGISRRELSGIPASAWWRLKLAAGASSCRLVVMSPVAQVPCAAVRVSLNGKLGMEDFAVPRRDLVARLRMVSERMKRAN
ncbi:hypothetical protein [Haloferula sp. BvORR071]|uniref:hypothetical protein n=1 Tax=Haloferula sp. BvORR071 TaxID=1396141 RepID=UPI00054F8ED5|nr:hypothetical protein [Haloferula sp. BvORR071]